MKNLTHLLFIIIAILIVGCSPKPDDSLILWEQPSPDLASAAHVKERPGLIRLYVLPTGSMEPFMTGGDFIVVDTKVPFTKKDLPDGTPCLYMPNELQRQFYPNLPPGVPIVHMLAAWSGDECIMDGIANKHYERGVLRMNKETYVGKVIKVYTARARS